MKTTRIIPSKRFRIAACLSLPVTASLLASCSTALAQLTVPGDARSAGLHYIVPDVACWWDATGNFVTNGFINLAEAADPAGLGG
jgi:hypothetical protein